MNIQPHCYVISAWLYAEFLTAIDKAREVEKAGEFQPFALVNITEMESESMTIFGAMVYRDTGVILLTVHGERFGTKQNLYVFPPDGTAKPSNGVLTGKVIIENREPPKGFPRRVITGSSESGMVKGRVLIESKSLYEKIVAEAMVLHLKLASISDNPKVAVTDKRLSEIWADVPYIRSNIEKAFGTKVPKLRISNVSLDIMKPSITISGYDQSLDRNVVVAFVRFNSTLWERYSGSNCNRGQTNLESRFARL